MSGGGFITTQGNAVPVLGPNSGGAAPQVAAWDGEQWGVQTYGQLLPPVGGQPNLLPPSIADNCVLWIQGERDVTVPAFVSSWGDESGAGNTVTQATGANQPGFNQTDPTYGDAPSVFFLGNNFLTGPGTGGVTLYAQPLTVYFVGKVNAGVAQATAFLEGVTNRLIIRQEASGNWSFFAGNLLTSGTANDGLPHVFCAVFNGANSALYMDRFDVPIVTGNAGANPIDIFCVGGNPGLGDGLQGSIASGAAFKGAHGSYVRQRVMAALGARASQSRIIVCDGNSLTIGPGGGVIPYPTQLATLLNDANVVITNNGVGGQTTTAMQAYAVTHTYPLYKALARQQIVIPWEITNDLFFGASAATAYSNYVAACLAYRAVGFKVIAMSVLSRSNAGTPANFNALRAVVNTRLDANWRAFADAYVPLHRDPRIGYDGAETDPTYFDGSLVHLNTTGMGIPAGGSQNAIATLTWP